MPAEIILTTPRGGRTSLHRLDARERIQFVEWLAQSFSSGDMALIQCRFDSLERWETLLQEVA